MNQNLTQLHNEIQLIIDAFVQKKYKAANDKLTKINDVLNDLIDSTTDDETLVELGKYQVMLDHLKIKINTAE